MLCCFLLSCPLQMSSASVARFLSSRLSTIPLRLQINHLTQFPSPIVTPLSSALSISFTRRSFALSARHVQSQPDFLPTSASSFSQLSFVELAARTSSFLINYYEAPTASPVIAAQLLTALQQFDVDGQQRQLKERLEGELDELVNEGKQRRERRLGDDDTHHIDDPHKDHTHDEHEQHDDVLRVQQLDHDHDDDETLEQRIIARPPLPPHLHELDFHIDGDMQPKTASGGVGGGGGGVARGKFDSGYSTDQLLVDSLPTLKEEEAVQLGRRDVMKLMATRE